MADPVDTHRKLKAALGAMRGHHAVAIVPLGPSESLHRADGSVIVPSAPERANQLPADTRESPPGRKIDDSSGKNSGDTDQEEQPRRLLKRYKLGSKKFSLLRTKSGKEKQEDELGDTKISKESKKNTENQEVEANIAYQPSGYPIFLPGDPTGPVRNMGDLRDTTSPLPSDPALDKWSTVMAAWDKIAGSYVDNSNPEGCNQYSGPGCSLSSHASKVHSILSANPAGIGMVNLSKEAKLTQKAAKSALEELSNAGLVTTKGNLHYPAKADKGGSASQAKTVVLQEPTKEQVRRSTTQEPTKEQTKQGGSTQVESMVDKATGHDLSFSQGNTRGNGLDKVPTASEVAKAIAVKSNRYGMVHLADLRDELKVDTPTLHKVVRELQDKGILTVEGAEGRHGLSDRDKEVLMDLGHGPKGLHIGVRDEAAFARLRKG